MLNKLSNMLRLLATKIRYSVTWLHHRPILVSKQDTVQVGWLLLLLLVLLGASVSTRGSMGPGAQRVLLVSLARCARPPWRPSRINQLGRLPRRHQLGKPSSLCSRSEWGCALGLHVDDGAVEQALQYVVCGNARVLELVRNRVELG